ncbi:biotin/lipoyl-containing protein [Streptomyces sp. NPDC006510]|uniref:biotin/lipoyl-containing protein n=1 Tax=Streptomyces sp. NPDC006510 TaxID=3155600 RepID=UPI0033B603BE
MPRTASIWGSPEQIRGQEAGPASDVFCLAAVLAYAATGKGPFGDGPTEAVIYRVVHDEPELSRIPADIAPLIAAGLAKAPDERPGITEFLGRCAALAGSDGLRLPDGVTELIKEQTARTKALTARAVPRPPTPPQAPPAPPRTAQQVRATGQKTAIGYTPVALPWLPGKTAGARSARIVRWHKQVGDEVAVDEPLIDVSSVRGDTVITSPANGTLLAVYRNNGTSARIGSVVAGIGTPGAKVPRVRRLRIDRLALLVLACAIVVALVVGLVGAQSSLFMGDIDAAREGDCVAQEYPEGNRNADWFTQPCVFMQLRAFLSDSSEDKYYSKVLYRDPPVKCSESAKEWSESDDHEAEVGDMVLCLEPL